MAKKILHNTADEEIAYSEEEQNLEEIESKIDAVILRNEKRAEELKGQISDFYASNRAEREGKIYLMESRNSHLNNIDTWNSYKGSPYFGRMDLTRNGSETKTYFIGEKGISDGAELYVLDWRTELGGTFSNKHETRYNVEGNDYKLVLRRAVDIKNSNLINVKTEYDAGALSLDGDVIDPFLISVLRDKRRNYKLTDIIRTIQENQNNLIRNPIDESFIIQGCAGSGKTMILLHRLSYIAYNHPDFNFSRCFILTPSEQFNFHVDELSRKLELNNIKRLTVEMFYSDRIRSLGKNDTYISDRSKRTAIAKVEPVPDTVESEKLLSAGMLEEIYSVPFYESIIEHYENHWKNTLGQLDSIGLRTILSDCGKSNDVQTTHDHSEFVSLKNAVSEIISSHSAAIKAYDKAKEELNTAERLIRERRSDLEYANSSLKPIKAVFISELTEAEKNYSKRLKELQDDMADAMQIISNAKSGKAVKFAEIKSLEDEIAFINKNRDKLKTAGFLRSSDSNIAHIILAKCFDVVQEVETAAEQYNNVPFYNFGKRSRAKSELEKAISVFSREVDGLADEYISKNSVKAADLRREIANLDIKITDANVKMVSSAESMALEKKVGSIKACLSLFKFDELPDIERKLKPNELENLPDKYKSYADFYKKTRESEGLLNFAERKKAESSAIIEKSRDNIIGPETIEKLKSSLELIDQLDFSVLYSSLQAELSSVYNKYGQEMRRGVFYRHQLMYKLLLCSLYYGRRMETQYFANIDEAQDLSKTEYMLLRRILGPKTVFNLYGDVNQLVYSYKGITQWDEIAAEITPNVYFLNENYRNTLQITDFCNKEFEADITGIGLTGKEVKTLPFGAAAAELLEIKKSYPKCRAAVIYRRGLENVSNALSDISGNTIFGKVDNSKISVITVEESKGLEFDAVMAICTQMSSNEKYVAYTRALDNLIITDLPGSEIRFDFDEDQNNASEEDLVPETYLPDMQIASVQDKPSDIKVRLTGTAENVQASNAMPYIDAFFENGPDSKDLFVRLFSEVVKTTPEIMLRVSDQYIGAAAQNEKYRFYVWVEDGKAYIKFNHLYSKEEFNVDHLYRYLRSYDQCCQYIKEYPDSIAMKNDKYTV